MVESGSSLFFLEKQIIICVFLKICRNHENGQFRNELAFLFTLWTFNFKNFLLYKLSALQTFHFTNFPLYKLSTL